jgi:lipopolysaccharide/colanic/teichoic acid biosynthesis glycosyltransferase
MSTAPSIGSSDAILIGDRLKRLVGVLVAVVSLVATLPLMVFIALALKWEERHAPVFHRTPRIGSEGQRFQLLSFRTYPHDPVRRTVRDLKRTALGNFLYYARLADLPRLVNLLRGDISI